MAVLTLVVPTAGCGPKTESGEKLSQDRPQLPVPDVKPKGFVAPLADLSAYQAQRLEWKKCDGHFTCADIVVPLDYREPGKQGITLSMKRRAATAKPRLGTLFINPGGPGGSGKELVASFAAKGLEQYDIVGWDPRGVGDSTPVQCMQGKELEHNYTAIDSTPDNAQEAKALRAGISRFAASCLEKSGPLLSHVSTEETVQDLDLLRTLVGDAKLNFFGYSYGTQVGAYYAQRFGKNVGRMVLDGAVNIGDREDVIQAVGFDRALQGFAKWCVKEGQCTDLGDTPEKVIGTITDYLHKLDTNPVKVGDRELTEALGVTGVLTTLYSEQSWRYLALGMSRAVNGDAEPLLQFADLYYQRDAKGHYGSVALSFPAIRCLDEGDDGYEAAVKKGEADAKMAPIFGKFLGGDVVCPVWPVKPVAPIGKITGPGAGPILVVGSTGDSATPYEFAEDMAKQLQSGHLLTLEGEGHGAYGSGSKCLDSAIAKYLVTGDLPAEGTRCKRD